jgi:hypothetical protein
MEATIGTIVLVGLFVYGFLTRNRYPRHGDRD